jgi:hypothetical protein
VVGGIFLSYRRDDTAGFSGRLADDLRDALGDDVVFLDIDRIAPGTDFVDAITSAADNAEVLLAVIGRRWLTAKNAERRRRIDDPGDYVRLEITAALQRGRRIIPVLVDGARLPRPQDLPDPMKPMLRHNAIELSDSRWDYDLGVLLDQLRPAPPAPEDRGGPAEDRHAPALQRLRIRLGLAGALGALLLAVLVVGLVQAGHGPRISEKRTSQESPTTAVAAPPASPSSSVPETTTTTPVATTRAGSSTPATQSTSPSASRPPAQPQATTPPKTAPPPSTPPPTAPRPTTAPPPPAYTYEKLSGDGAFGAYKTADGNHYIVRRVSTGEMVFTTHPQFAPSDADNDVKAATFCPGNVFAATYHYWGGASIYSWIGYWNAGTGSLVREQRVDGELYSPQDYC